jgi:uncharacterized Zn finger protein
MLKIPRPGQDWECPKCGNRGTNYMVCFDGYTGPNCRQVILLRCNRCGYFEQRAPLDAEEG